MRHAIGRVAIMPNSSCNCDHTVQRLTILHVVPPAGRWILYMLLMRLGKFAKYIFSTHSIEVIFVVGGGVDTVLPLRMQIVSQYTA